MIPIKKYMQETDKNAYKKVHNRKNEETFFMWILYLFKAIIALFSVAFLATEISFYGKSIVEFVCVYISAPSIRHL